MWSHTLGDYIFIVIAMLHLQLPPIFIMNGYIDRNLAIKKLIYKRVTLATRTNDCLVVQRYCNKISRHDEVNSELLVTPDTVTDIILKRIMPPRRRWVALGQKNRFVKDDLKYIEGDLNPGFIPISTVRKNYQRISMTIKRDRKLPVPPHYLKKLDLFLDNLEKRVSLDTYDLKVAKIIPEVKDPSKPKGKKALRPICIFRLADGVIFQLTCAKLTKGLDALFQPCSFAFRCRRQDGSIPNHHETIPEILAYKEKHDGKQIFVAECDLKKFFDLINHKIIIQELDAALASPSCTVAPTDIPVIRKLFYAYLGAYDFRKTVKPLNDNEDYLSEHGLRYGDAFEWVSDKELESMYGKHPEEGIGIPQGGALSGFIANLILNKVDTVLMQQNDPDLLYLRYCDDMLMLHTDRLKLERVFSEYQALVLQQRLFIHPPKSVDSYSKTFYATKSKNPYMWGKAEEGNVPWISFVGYQVGFKGEIRVRARSIEKEVAKQEKIVQQVRKIIKEANGPNSIRRIKSSVIHRMIGMSVGRIAIYNPCPDNDLCWANGFKELTKNPYSIKQMRYLDQKRHLAMKKLYTFLKKGKWEQTTNEEDIYQRDGRKNQPILYFGKPYSYCGWLELKEKSHEE